MLDFSGEITCHSNEWRTSKDKIYWRPNTEGEHTRSCSYCGSLHPEDLVWWMENKGMKLEGADWKYGWPHKFYLELGPKYPIKFYNTHLSDLAPETFQYVADLIETRARVKFTMEDGKLGAYAPHGWAAGMERFMDEQYMRDLDAWWERLYKNNPHLRKPNVNTDKPSLE